MFSYNNLLVSSHFHFLLYFGQPRYTYLVECLDMKPFLILVQSILLILSPTYDFLCQSELKAYPGQDILFSSFLSTSAVNLGWALAGTKEVLVV
jgi:hypothetical protein